MLSLKKKIKTKPYQNNTICYFFGYFRKLFKVGFFFNRKNIIVVYCFGTEFVKFTVREIKD